MGDQPATPGASPTVPTRRGRRRRAVTIAVAVVAAGLVAMVLALVVTMGPVGTFRLLRYGDTTVTDYRHYPGLAFPASSQATPWPADLAGPEPVVTAPSSGAQVPISELVASTDTTALVVVVDGVLRHETYGDGREPADISQLFSVSKSALSLLIGAAIDDGLLTSADQPITDLLPELDPGFADVTLEHLLRMTSGSGYVENDNPFGTHVRFNYTDRLEREILALRPSSPPGEAFRYRSGDNAMLGLALSRAVTTAPEVGAASLTEYFSTRLWERIGAETGGVWSTDDDGGLERTWCCLATSARDLARLGQLVLDDGAWGDDQVISAEWIARSTTGRVLDQDVLPGWFQDSPIETYGYQWWVVSIERGDVAAIGKDGQLLYVDPVRRAVVVRLGVADGGLGSSAWIGVGSQVVDQVLARSGG